MRYDGWKGDKPVIIRRTQFYAIMFVQYGLGFIVGYLIGR